MRTLMLASFCLTFLLAGAEATDQPAPDTAAGWVKHPNPVLGGDLGTCFDISVLKEGDTYRMWFSWRPKKSIALVESKDGIKWSKPVIVLGPNAKTDWENDLNRPVVIKNGDLYQMWYTGQARGKSWIGFATSKDGKAWGRMSDKPVLAAEKPWEKVAVMCPHVIYDEKAKVYRMWYSGGDQHEPDAIGYATSEDGIKWVKHEKNPIFKPDPKNASEKNRVTGCQVIHKGDWHIMFYIGFRDVNFAQISIARSKDGITETGNVTLPTPSFVRARDSGTKTPCTSRMRSTTGNNGSCGTTVAREASSRSGWLCIQGKTWASEVS